jgi:ABC-type lipoprotein release transport system permease subunit
MGRLEAQRNILDFTLSSLLRRKGKNSALVIVYTLVVFLLASVMFFTHSIHREASLILRDAPEIVVQKLVAGRQDLISLDYIDKIKDIRGVSSVKGRLWGYYFDQAIGANYTLMVPDGVRMSPGTIEIGDGIMQSRQVYQGDLLTLRAYNGAAMFYQVEKIFSAESALVSSDLILMGEEDFRSLFQFPEGQVTDLTLKVENPRELTTIARKIAEILPGTRPIIRDEILRTYDSVFDWRGGLLIVILFVAVLCFIIFAWDKASGLSAEERREIGILKAIGWETSDVIMMKFWEWVVVSLTAFLLGIVFAYLHVFFTSSILFEPVLKGWAVLYPDFKLVPFIDVFQLATLFFLTVMPYTVATIVPSWRAATVDPDAVMRT